MMQSARDAEAGFTLIEALVAMVVLGFGAVSLMTAAEGYTGRITEVSERVAARWVAENELVSARLGLGADDGAIEMFGQEFTVVRVLSETQDADLKAINIRVSRSNSGRQLFVLDGYVATEVTL